MPKPRRPRTSKFYNYYPYNQDEQDYIAWCKAPGEDLEIFIGVGPTIEERIRAARERERQDRAAHVPGRGTRNTGKPKRFVPAAGKVKPLVITGGTPKKQKVRR